MGRAVVLGEGVKVERAHGPRRVRVLRLDPSLLFFLIQRPDERSRLTSVGMPGDARFLGAYYDDMYQMFRVHVESESFEPVPEGVMPPELDVTFTVHYDVPEAGEASVERPGT